MTIRIIIADDHSVVRQGLRMFLGLDLRRGERHELRRGGLGDPRALACRAQPRGARRDRQSARSGSAEVDRDGGLPRRDRRVGERRGAG